MNAARPAVQLCCPYQSVKIAPSRATRSMFGVRYPMTPLLYALMLNQPMSSPQMMRMFGLVVSARAAPSAGLRRAPLVPCFPLVASVCDPRLEYGYRVLPRYDGARAFPLDVGPRLWR